MDSLFLIIAFLGNNRMMLNMRSACYHWVQKFLLSDLLSKHVSLKCTKL